MTNIYSRTAIAAQYCNLKNVSRSEGIALIASVNHLSETTVAEIVEQAAVRAYLHALGISHEPALEVLIAAARKFRIPTESLQSAVDEHLLSVEAL